MTRKINQNLMIGINFSSSNFCKFIFLLIFVFFILNLNTNAYEICNSSQCLNYEHDYYNFEENKLLNLSIDSTFNLTIQKSSQISLFYLQDENLIEVGVDFNNQLDSGNHLFYYNISNLEIADDLFVYFNLTNQTNNYSLNSSISYVIFNVSPENNSVLNHFDEINISIFHSNLSDVLCDVYVDANLNSQDDFVFTNQITNIEIIDSDYFGYHTFYLKCENDYLDIIQTPNITIRRRDYENPRLNILDNQGLLFHSDLTNSFFNTTSVSFTQASFVFTFNSNSISFVNHENFSFSFDNSTYHINYFDNNFNFTGTGNGRIVLLIGSGTTNDEICLYENLKLLGCNQTTSISQVNTPFRVTNSSGFLSQFAYYDDVLDFNEVNDIYFDNFSNPNLYYDYLEEINIGEFSYYNVSKINSSKTKTKDFVFLADDNFFDILNCQLYLNAELYDSFDINNSIIQNVNLQESSSLIFQCEDQDNNFNSTQKEILFNDDFDVNLLKEINFSKITYNLTNIDYNTYFYYTYNQNNSVFSSINDNSDVFTLNNLFLGKHYVFFRFIDDYANILDTYDYFFMNSTFNYDYAYNVSKNKKEIKEIEFILSNQTNIEKNQNITRLIKIRITLNNSYNDRLIIDDINLKKTDLSFLFNVNLSYNDSYFNSLGTRVRSKVSFNNDVLKSDFEDIIPNTILETFPNYFPFMTFSSNNVLSLYLSYSKATKNSLFLRAEDYVMLDLSDFLSSQITCEEQIKRGISNVCYKTSPFYMSTNAYREFYVTHDDYPTEITINKPSSTTFEDSRIEVDLELNEESTCRWYSDLSTSRNELDSGYEINRYINFYPPNEFYYLIFFECIDEFGNKGYNNVSVSIEDSTEPNIDLFYNLTENNRISLEINLTENSHCYISNSSDLDEKIVDLGNFVTKTYSLIPFENKYDYDLICIDQYNNTKIKGFEVEPPEEEEEVIEDGDTEEEIIDEEENLSQEVNETTDINQSDELNTSINHTNTTNTTKKVTNQTNINQTKKEIIQTYSSNVVFDELEPTYFTLENETFSQIIITSDYNFEDYFVLNKLNTSSANLNLSNFESPIDLIELKLNFSENEDKLSRTRFLFKIDDSQLADTKKELIRLYRSESGENWDELETEYINSSVVDNITYYNYFAISNGFSYYLISKKIEPKQEPIINDSQTNLSQEEDKNKNSILSIILFWLIIFSIIILTPSLGGYVYFKKNPEELKKVLDYFLKFNIVRKYVHKFKQKNKSTPIVERNVDDLIGYIKEYKEKKVPRKTVEKELIKRGWAKDEIKDAYDSIYANLSLKNHSSVVKHEKNTPLLDKTKEFLKPYILEFRKRGLTDNKIRKELLKQEWSPEEIDYALTNV